MGLGSGRADRRRVGAGVLAAAAVFQVSSLLAVWIVEAACDRRAARAEGRAASLDAFAYIAAAQAADRAASRWRRAGGLVLRWAAGPSHPPLPLRRALVRAARANDAGVLTAGERS